MTNYGILQARILEWVAFLFSRGSSQPRDWNHISPIAGRVFISWATKEATCIATHVHEKQFYLALLKWFIFTCVFFFCTLKMYLFEVTVMFWNYGFQTRLCIRINLDTLKKVQIPRYISRAMEPKCPELELRHVHFTKNSGGFDAAIWKPLC